MDAGIKYSGKTFDGQHRAEALTKRHDGPKLEVKSKAAGGRNVTAIIGGATIRSIAMVDLFIDRTYQRELDEARSKKIAENMNASIFGEITVADRGNGKFAIVDGQHRYHALCIMGYNKPGFTVVCRVLTGMSIEDEAMTFAYLGGFKNTRRALNAFALWKARVAGAEPVATDIEAIVNRRGLSICEAKKRGTISAVRTLEAVYNSGNLEATLDAAKAWANGEANTSEFYDGDVLRALSTFLHEYNGEVEPATLGKRLHSIVPAKLMARIKETVRFSGWSQAKATRSVICEQFNMNLRKKLRAPRDFGGGVED